MSYKSIKWILKKQIDANAKTLWTWDRGKTIKDENFTCIYKAYSDSLQIYTAQQLLDKLDGKADIQSDS
jgi:hypothetical protein